MNRILIILIYLTAVFCSGAYSQTGEWSKRYNGSGNDIDVAHSVTVDALGNVYVTGLSIGSGTMRDYLTIKYNSAGDQQWSVSYNGTGNGDDVAHGVGVDALGNVYVGGYSWGGPSNYDYAVVKYNSSGAQQWAQRYNGPGNGYDYAYSFKVDAAGNSYITGESVGANYDYCTIKYNSAGAEEWVSRFNGSQNGYDRANALAIDAVGNVYVTGRSQWTGNDNDYVTIKYNSLGVYVWGFIYNGAANDWDEAHAIAADDAGNVYVTGYSISSGSYSDYATVKYNAAGVQQWAERYSVTGTNSDRAYAIAVDGMGNVFVTGRLFGGAGTNWNYGTIKYSSTGNREWVNSYDGPGQYVDIAYAIAVDGAGNVYVTGSSDELVTADYATVKYNTSGTQQWAARYNGTGNESDHANAMTLDAAGNIYVVGASFGIGSSDDYVTLKYSQQIGIANVSTEIPNKFSLGQNYPNPFNPVTNIKMDIQHAGSVKLVVYDILGKEVETLVNEHLSAGSFKIDWDASAYQSGVYYYRMTSGVFSETKKLILIK
jgi:uncharacterized delta-60 repeat protein